MGHVLSYARPSTLEEALALLRDPRAAVMGGGTTLNATKGAGLAAPGVDGAAAGGADFEVVDLQAAGLGGIERVGASTVRIGATTTLYELHRNGELPTALREAARRERPSGLRSQSTVGGRVAVGHAESELLAVLLVHEAIVTVVTSEGSAEVPLEELLERLPLAPGSVITAVGICTSGGATTTARTARTPADRAIVFAAARTGSDGRLRVALSGVAARPLVVGAADLDALDPPGDFRGSSDYRRALAGVLYARVAGEV